MRLPEFSYIEAQSVQEACGIIAGSESFPLSGGTDLLVKLKHKLLRPAQLVDLKKISGLDSIRQLADGHISIGALTTLTVIERSEILKQQIPSISIAAQSVGTPQIRNKATLGGNICLDTRCWYYNMPAFSRQTRSACNKQGGACCHVVTSETQGRCYSLFSSDTVPVLIALGSRVKLSSAQEERVLPLTHLY